MLTITEAELIAEKLSRVFDEVYIDGKTGTVIARRYSKDENVDRQMAHRAKQLKEAGKVN